MKRTSTTFVSGIMVITGPAGEPMCRLFLPILYRIYIENKLELKVMAVTGGQVLSREELLSEYE